MEIGKMKAQVLHNIADIRYEDADMPRLKSGWVLVKVKAAGVCGSDIPRIYKTGAHVHPLIPGHEFSGQVVDVYDSDKTELIGKRVGVFPLIPCMECDCCKKRQYEMCKHYNYLGSRCDGGFAEYVAVPEWNLIELPDNVPYIQAAMMEPMAVAVHAIRRFPFIVDNAMGGCNDIRVCVIGLGTIGLLLTMFLKDMGVRNISVICNKEAQAAYAKQLGIQEDNIYMASNDTDMQGEDKTYDYIYECVGRNDTVNQAIKLAAPASHIVFVGNPYSDMHIDKDIYWNILRKQIKISGTWNSSYYGNSGSRHCKESDIKSEECNSYMKSGYSDIADATKDDWTYVLERLAYGNTHPEYFVTHKYSLADIQQGMKIMRDKTEDYVKIMYVADEC